MLKVEAHFRGIGTLWNADDQATEHGAGVGIQNRAGPAKLNSSMRVAEYAAAQSAIRRIAREGRKYGIGLMLVSQRPADIESTVISQCGTWLVLRLTNSADQQHVARFLPDGLSGMTKVPPALGQQEAIFVGEGAALPARIRIDNLPPEHRPRFESVAFAEGWGSERLTSLEVAKVAARMDGSPQA